MSIIEQGKTINSISPAMYELCRDNVARIKYNERVHGVRVRFAKVRARYQCVDLHMMRLNFFSTYEKAMKRWWWQ